MSKTLTFHQHPTPSRIAKAISPNAPYRNPTVKKLIHDLVRLREENRALLCELHKVQESLEKNIEKNGTIQITDSAPRPARWVYGSHKVTTETSDKSGSTLLWVFKDVQLYNIDHAEIAFKTKVRNGQLSLIFPSAQSGDVNHWLPRAKNQHLKSEFVCAPADQSLNHPDNAILNSLNTTSWEKLKDLVCKFASLLEDPITHKVIDEIDSDSLLRGMKDLKTKLDNFPKLVRYDSISLQQVISENQYTGISILLRNASFGNQQWESLQYRLSTIDDIGGEVGQNPRLEFPESTKHIFENWHAETIDARGKRLEVRFAQPSLMDTNVWNKLTSNDQILIACIIRTLPDQLFELQNQSKSQDIHWPNFYKICFDIKKILGHTISGKQSSKQTTNTI